MNNLKRIMDDVRVDVLIMAERTGYSKRTIYDWINGASIPGLYAARVAADFLNVTDKEIWP